MRSRAAVVALALTVLAAPPSRGEPVSALPGRASERAVPPFLFEITFAIDDLRETSWTEAQRREIAGIVRRIGEDDRIRLVVQVRTDPIGSREENARWGKAVAEAVAARLVTSGVPAGRVAVAAGVEAGDLGGDAPWTEFARFQRVVIRGMREGVPPPARPSSPRRGEKR